MTLAMNPEIRAQWCAALRSSDYKQGRGALQFRDPANHVERYCCLGVLTDLWLKAGNGEMVPDEYGDGPGDQFSVWENPEGCLSKPVAQWAGLSDTDPELRPGLHGGAVEVNDLGASFDEIANLIDGGAS